MKEEKAKLPESFNFSFYDSGTLPDRKPDLKELIESVSRFLEGNLICIWHKDYYFLEDDFFHTPEKLEIVFSGAGDVSVEKILDFLKSSNLLSKIIQEKKPVFHTQPPKEITGIEFLNTHTGHSPNFYGFLPLMNAGNQMRGILIFYSGKESIRQETLLLLARTILNIIETHFRFQEKIFWGEIAKKHFDGIIIYRNDGKILHADLIFLGIKQDFRNRLLPDVFEDLKISFEETISPEALRTHLAKGTPLKKVAKIKHQKRKITVTIECQPYSTESRTHFFYCLLKDVTLFSLSFQTQKEEERLHEFLKETLDLFSGISHEIRTPLNVIISIVDYILKHNKNEEIHQELRLLKSTSEHLFSLLDSILDYRKIETGQIEIHKKVIELDKFLYRIVDVIQHLASERKVKFFYKFSKELPVRIITDPVRLNQILINILSYVLKFSGSGEIHFHVEVLERKDYITFISFFIHITDATNLYQKLSFLFRTPGQSSEENRITSASELGLVITKKLMNLLKGEITFSERENQGNAVILDFPFETSTDEETPQNAGKFFFTSDICILIVDDYYPNVLIIKKFLELWNIKTDIATGGEEAVRKAKNNRYDLILMDLHMPDVDGYEASKMIREFSPDIPIIAITASPSENPVSKLRSHGITDVLVKPFPPEELYRKILHHIFHSGSSS